MINTDELKSIKKEYGEKFMHLCREMFPTLLERDGLLTQILSESFSENCKKYLYEDITEAKLEEEFQSYIYSKVNVEAPEIEIIENRTPYEILDKAGYNLYECTTEEEIQSFRKYYKKGEELCTFWGDRLNKCVVFFAVKKNVEDIKREDFENPEREDEYGTSVMGIQFNKIGICTVSIKNRYNHRVNNPDATYGNDLEKIAPGLTESFARLLKERNLELNNSVLESFKIPEYTVANDGKHYKFNMEIDQIYYCPENVIIDFGTPKKIRHSESQILVEQFIIDTKEKTVKLCEEYKYRDSFVDDLKELDKIEIQKMKNGNRKILLYKKDEEEPVIIKINKNNQIIGYENKTLTQVGDNFLTHNKNLTELTLPNLLYAGNNFLRDNDKLKKLKLPNLLGAGKYFLSQNDSLTEIDMPNLTQVGNFFLYQNNKIKEVSLPNLTYAGDYFLNKNKILNKLELPNLIEAGSNFLEGNNALQKLSFPNLTKVGSFFLFHNNSLIQLSLPKLTKMEDWPLRYNNSLIELSAPNLVEVGSGFLMYNQTLTRVSFPKLKRAGDWFFDYNNTLVEVSVPSLEEAYDSFLRNNQILKELSVPNLTKYEENFLYSNKELRKKIIEDVENKKKKITSQDIAILDKNNKITVSETNIAKQVLENQKEEKSKLQE